tara:strand:- start:268 stop:525 length:258 start_codon:yes stop_codon:yes gene_type:complete
MSNQTIENLVCDLEDWIFEISRIVKNGYQLSPESIAFLQNIHPALDKLSEEMLDIEHRWNEMKQAEAEENNAYLQGAAASVREVL